VVVQVHGDPLDTHHGDRPAGYPLGPNEGAPMFEDNSRAVHSMDAPTQSVPLPDRDASGHDSASADAQSGPTGLGTASDPRAESPPSPLEPVLESYESDAAFLIGSQGHARMPANRPGSSGGAERSVMAQERATSQASDMHTRDSLVEVDLEGQGGDA